MGKKGLFEKIKSLSEFFPPEIFKSVDQIRKITNNGAHQAGHKDLSPSELHEALTSVSLVCEWTIASCIKKHGFTTDSWTPTVLSAFQPRYRIRILTDLLAYTLDRIEDKGELLRYLVSVQECNDRIMFSAVGEGQHVEDDDQDSRLYQQAFLIIDKLAMAYLKDRRYEESIAFVESTFRNKLINNRFRQEMLDKLSMLQHEVDNLPISRSMEQTKHILRQIIPAIDTKDRSLFLTVVMAIAAQDELLNIETNEK